MKPLTTTFLAFVALLSSTSVYGTDVEVKPRTCTDILAQLRELSVNKTLKGFMKTKWNPIFTMVLKDFANDPNIRTPKALLDLLPQRMLKLSDLDDEVMQVILELVRGDKNEKDEWTTTPLTKQEFVHAILTVFPGSNIEGRDLLAAYRLVGRDPAALLEAIADGTITFEMLQAHKPKKVIN